MLPETRGNDLAMLALADRSFAPLDSPAKVQAGVDRIIDRRKEGILAAMIGELR